ncbi:peptidoglycan D,D-transpeptidase FtsI family protein [Erythrobacter oryzae]|uniref:peptidoglycan D,D-transpeptidase FtsI family protein n=1 Tax=Erythrobacter oryzae TaxID=3019556 RepID=UPI002552FCFE|nr:penicillin-binding protein 2 [Erythrobacter sp. COR-2]
MNAIAARPLLSGLSAPLRSAHAATPVIPAGRLPGAGIRAQMLWSARLRVLWLLGGFGAIALIALLRIATLGLGGNAPQRTSLEEALLPPRGEITDRNGAPLARAFPAYAMWFNPKAMGDSGSPLVRSPAEVARALKEIFPDIDEARMAKRLASGQAGYLRRRLLPEEANRVFALGEIALEIPRETDRYYPQGTLAAHVLGYVVEDQGGKLGMEEVLEKRLSNPDLRTEPVALSLDLRVQGALEDELRKGMLATNALGAAGIVLDVETGEVMAMASLPEFDPNTAGAAGAVNVFNRATNGVYELGSTFKPLTVAAAIDAGVVRDLGRQWNAAPVPVGSRTIKDSHAMGPSLNVPQALVHSSNTVTARVADELGPERLRRAMIDLGMDRRPFIELPAKGKPIWPQGAWSRVTNMTVGFGHGLAVTPLHLASAYAAMVNGGIWRPATLMRLAPADVPRGRRVFKESTSSRMRQLLRMISLYGTGKSADAPGYRVGGKTGSAEKAGVGGYNKTALVSSFAAAFPMDAPRYVVVVVVDEPKGTMASSFQRTAAFTSAPIVGKLVPRIGPMLGVQPDDSRDVDISDLRYLVDKGE